MKGSRHDRSLHSYDQPTLRKTGQEPTPDESPVMKFLKMIGVATLAKTLAEIISEHLHR